MRLVGILNFATVDEKGAPQVRQISAIHYEPDAIYFYTARGKNFCKELLADCRVQINAYTRFKESIRLSGKAVPAEDQEHWKDVIFEEQPYLVNVYPGDTRSIGIIFQITDAEIEYFNLGTRPIFREYYTIGNATITPKGFQINPDECIACGTCASVCPQDAIDEGDAYYIRSHNCLHCGNCIENCPVQAIKRL